jgi:hypothetical protein
MYTYKMKEKTVLMICIAVKQKKTLYLKVIISCGVRDKIKE